MHFLLCITYRSNVMAVSGIQGHVKLFFLRKTKRSNFDPVEMVRIHPNCTVSAYGHDAFKVDVHPNINFTSSLDFIHRSRRNNHCYGLSLRGSKRDARYRHPSDLVL